MRVLGHDPMSEEPREVTAVLADPSEVLTVLYGHVTYRPVQALALNDAEAVLALRP